MDIASYLTDDGYLVSWTTVEENPSSGQCILCLLDVDSPYLSEMDEVKYQRLQGYMSSLKDCQLIWVTRQDIAGKGPKDIDPNYGLTAGFLRTLRQESSFDLITVGVDQADAPSARSLVQILKSVYARHIEPDDVLPGYEFAISTGDVCVSRCYWASPSLLVSEPVQTDARARLEVDTLGTNKTLIWVTDSEPVLLGVNDVEIDIKFVGMNFRDIMIMHGFVGDSSEFGHECSGIVRRVGSGVKDLHPGDQVAAFSPGCFRSRTTLRRDRCVLLLADDNLADAASLPCAYSTAYCALRQLTDPQKDQTVLIHSACGAVGLAAIFINQQAQATIYATVSSKEKVDYLVNNLGIPRSHIVYSRDTSFLPDLMQATDGRGVDVVLNSLAGPLLHSSWACVAPFGKMIELGKRDFLTHGSLEMAPFLENRAFFGLDLLKFTNSASWQKILVSELQKLMSALSSRPTMPARIYAATEVADAFRYMQEGKHVGKILIQMHEDPVTLLGPEPDPLCSIRFNADACYLLVGGLGGIGRSISRWMVERGARHLIYLSRSAGQGNEDETALVSGLTMQGCQVTTVSGTVSVQDDVRRALAHREHKPLAGVIHLALELRDQVFDKMTYAEWTAATCPKAKGAWNLHQALEGQDLDFFILMGSLAGAVGNHGQSNYAAASSYLDALAWHRRRRGLPCSVLHLAVVEEMGIISQQERLMQQLGKRFYMLSEREVLEGVQLSMRQSRVATESASSSPLQSQPFITMIGLNDSQQSASDHALHRVTKPDARLGVYNNLDCRRIAQSNEVEADQLRPLIDRIKSNPTLLDDPATGQALTAALGVLIVARSSKAAAVDAEQVANLALDSLMAIEIKGAIRRHVGIDLPMADMTKAATVQGLVDLIIDRLKIEYTGAKKKGSQ